VKTIIFADAASKQFDSLPVDARSRISDALDAYAIHGRGDIKRLAGRQDFRLRVGQYRVIFDEDQTTIVAVYIGRRASGTYRRN
jgi:mRNA interferase RelE/StbE